MSSLSECPICRLKYKDFRCGYNFQSIVEFLWKENPPWPNKRRHGRLGKLREVMFWEIHLSECSNSTI
jgi:hypothetical protein